MKICDNILGGNGFCASMCGIAEKLLLKTFILNFNSTFFFIQF